MATSEAGPSKDVPALSEEISTLVGRGKKHLVCNEIMEAVNCFGEASSLAGIKYGQMGDECAESYYLYGTALLELSRMENGVLGNALTGVKVAEEGSDDEFEEAVGPKISEISEEEKNKVRTDVQEAMDSETKEPAADSTSGENEDGKTAKGQEKSDEKTKTDDMEPEAETKEGATKTKEQEEKDTTKTKEPEEKDATKTKEPEEKDATKTKEPEEKDATKTKETEEKDAKEKDDETEPMEEDGEDNDEEDDGEEEDIEDIDVDDGALDTDKKDAQSESEESKGDDVPTLQLAWEMLELAKHIYIRQKTEAKKKEAQSLEKLGEISLEQEQYSQAILDFKACLKLEEEVYEPENRALAEIHYNLGLAHSFDNKFEGAVTHFKKSVQTIQLKIKSLEEKITKAEEESKGKEKADDEDPCQIDKKEVEELQALLPEIMAKIEDAQEMKRSAATMTAAATEAMKMTMGVDITGGSSTSGFDSGFGFQDAKPADVKTIETKKADDITHLVRRKRKSDDDKPDGTTNEETPAKKVKSTTVEKPKGN